MPKKSKKGLPLKVRWEFVQTPDAEARIEAAFDIIFSHMEEVSADVRSPSRPHPESQEEQDQLPLF